MKKLLGLKLLTVLIFSCLVAVVSGCASSTSSYNQVALHMPRIKAGCARVVFYCSQPSNTAHEHDFVCCVDDTEVGHVSSRQFLFVDHAAGRIEVKARTTASPLLPPKHVSLNLEPGDVRYVRMDMKFTYPVDIQVAVVDSESGVGDLKTCTYVGRPLSAYSKR